jgi:hypothetical protein
MDDTLEDALKSFELGRKLLPAAKLSQVLSTQPCEGYLDILVQPSELSINMTTLSSTLITAWKASCRLNCLVLGAGTNDIFGIEIALTEIVSALKDLIKEKQRSAFDSIPANHLRLWNVSCLTPRFGTSMLTI